MTNIGFISGSTQPFLLTPLLNRQTPTKYPLENLIKRLIRLFGKAAVKGMNPFGNKEFCQLNKRLIEYAVKSASKGLIQINDQSFCQLIKRLIKHSSVHHL
ncbi:hypothetical protein QNH39_26415 [Neobacillus novalis]|uniref:Uncharacterized protein n=1 Tax=Neobacillus novalis TaxID=220687 RepID=A0AA95MQI5_9BACI|nr:hypothetical protein [Neobacillus novalis]WHY86065.1 hypothetical protein QNH39_26415 [Neobacillus novalis]